MHPEPDRRLTDGPAITHQDLARTQGNFRFFPTGSIPCFDKQVRPPRHAYQRMPARLRGQIGTALDRAGVDQIRLDAFQDSAQIAGVGHHRQVQNFDLTGHEFTLRVR